MVEATHLIGWSAKLQGLFGHCWRKGNDTMQIVDVTPVTKPRQTKRDKWKQRPCVMRYRAYADHLRAKMLDIPECGYHLIFIMPMPKSWSKKKRDAMRGKQHQQTPDKDNLEKAVLDALYGDDSCVWDGRVSKFWGDKGRVIVRSIPAFRLEELNETS